MHLDTVINDGDNGYVVYRNGKYIGRIQKWWLTDELNNTGIRRFRVGDRDFEMFREALGHLLASVEKGQADD